MLVLWDIDGTLMTTSGAGSAAFLEAGRELFGERFRLDGVDQLGRLDSVIWRDAAKVSRVEDPDESEIKFRAVYLNCYKYRLVSEPAACVLFPGVVDLIDRLEKQDHVIQGLLTGNYPEIGRMKLEIAGFDLRLFPVRAWGSDARTRPDLVPVALSRLREFNGTVLDSKQVLIIGDTPRDVNCARENGCRSLGVATGKFSRQALEEAGADIAVDDLADVEAILDWIIH